MAGKAQAFYQIVINASEVASVMDRHHHQPRHETMLKVWQRADTRTFCIANALKHRNEVSAIINSYKERPTIKESLASILTEKWDQEETSFLEVLKSIFPEHKLVSHFLSLQGEIARELKSLTIKNYRDEKLLKNANVHLPELSQEAEKLSNDEKKKITLSAKQFCENKGIKDEEIIKAVDSRLTKMRGTKLERKTIQVFGEENGTLFSEVDDLLASKVMESGGLTWLLQGKADALMGDTVIEVKNRRYKFMQPMYDLIQLQAYLFLYDSENGILLERFEKEQKNTPVQFEVGFWIEDVIPCMKAFVAEVDNLIKKNKKRFSEDCNKATNKSPLKRSCDEPDIKKLIPEKAAKLGDINLLILREGSGISCLPNFKQQ